MEEEPLKNRIILILGIFTAIFLISTVVSCLQLGKIKSSHDKEVFTRMDLEEKMKKAEDEKTALEAKINNLAKELVAEKATHSETDKELLQEQLVNESLKDELQKVTQPDKTKR